MWGVIKAMRENRAYYGKGFKAWLGTVVGGSLEVLQGLKLFLRKGIVPDDGGKQYGDRHRACFLFILEKGGKHKTENCKFCFFAFAFFFFPMRTLKSEEKNQEG